MAHVWGPVDVSVTSLQKGNCCRVYGLICKEMAKGTCCKLLGGADVSRELAKGHLFKVIGWPCRFISGELAKGHMW